MDQDTLCKDSCPEHHHHHHHRHQQHPVDDVDGDGNSRCDGDGDQGKQGAKHKRRSKRSNDVKHTSPSVIRDSHTTADDNQEKTKKKKRKSSSTVEGEVKKKKRTKKLIRGRDIERNGIGRDDPAQDVPLEVEEDPKYRKEKNADGIMKVKLLNDIAKVPERKTSGAAGFDLYCSRRTEIPAGETVNVPTGIIIGFDKKYFGLVRERSSYASKGLTTRGGIIDEDYRGEVYMMIHNGGDSRYDIEAGERVAQLVVMRYYTPDIEQVESLDETERGSGGFGSTGNQ